MQMVLTKHIRLHCAVIGGSATIIEGNACATQASQVSHPNPNPNL